MDNRCKKNESLPQLIQDYNIIQDCACGGTYGESYGNCVNSPSPVVRQQGNDLKHKNRLPAL